MGKLTVRSLAKKIEEDNQMFENATKAEKRVIIAQDCLDRIKLGQIEPAFSTMCKIYNDLETSQHSIKDYINTKKELICSACAKGSLFMSYIGRTNKLTFNEVESDNHIDGTEHSKLLKIFSAKQLSLIEFVFEGRQHLNFDKKGKRINLDKYYSKMRDFRFDNGTKKDYFGFDSNLLIVAICKNIIKNKGTFKL